VLDGEELLFGQYGVDTAPDVGVPNGGCTLVTWVSGGSKLILKSDEERMIVWIASRVVQRSRCFSIRRSGGGESVMDPVYRQDNDPFGLYTFGFIEEAVESTLWMEGEGCCGRSLTLLVLTGE